MGRSWNWRSSGKENTLLVIIPSLGINSVTLIDWTLFCCTSTLGYDIESWHFSLSVGGGERQEMSLADAIGHLVDPKLLTSKHIYIEIKLSNRNCGKYHRVNSCNARDTISDGMKFERYESFWLSTQVLLNNLNTISPMECIIVVALEIFHEEILVLQIFSGSSSRKVFASYHKIGESSVKQMIGHSVWVQLKASWSLGS